MRCCVITCCLDKSDCIGVETCNVLHCAAVSSLDIFGTSVLILRTKTDWRESLGVILQKSAIETAVPKISDDETAAQCNTLHVSTPIRSDLSRQQVMTERRIGATVTFLCIRIRFVLQQSSFSQYDLICPDSDV